MMTFSRSSLGRGMLLAILLAMPAALHAQTPPAPQPPAPPAQKAAPSPGAQAPAQQAPAAQAPQAAPAAPAGQPANPAQPQADAPDAQAGQDRALERAKTRIQELEARTDVAPAIRDQALTLLRTALGHNEAANASAASATRFQESAQRSPERVAEAKQQLPAL